MCLEIDQEYQFDVRSHYGTLRGITCANFSWRIIWQSKAPPKVVFFVWTTELGKILMVDNLIKRIRVIVDWCSV